MLSKNIAIIGMGLWGRNLVRNFYNLGALHTVCDIDEDNLNKVREEYSGVNVTKNFRDLLIDKSIEGIVVATPSHTHYKLVKQALLERKNVYVEKPISTVADEAKELMEIAEKNDLVLMVGHLLLYHPAVNRLRMLIQDGVLGDIKYVQSDRLNINYFKNDRSVMWDLAPHDVSMISYVINKVPQRVISAVGASSDGNDIMDITHITIEYEDGIIAHVSDSWIHPQKRVNLLVRGTKASAMFDDTLPEHKLQIFDNSKPGASTKVDLDYLEIEPLKLECQHFLNCIKSGRKARSDGENGYSVVAVLEAAEKMMLGERRQNLDKVDFALSRSKK